MQLDQNQTTTIEPPKSRYDVVGFQPPAPSPTVPTTPPVASTVTPTPIEQPKPRKPRTRKQPKQACYLKLPADLVKSLKLMALAEDRTQSDIATEALQEFVGEWVSPYKKKTAAA